MASIELRTPKNKPAYYKITANITLNGRTIRKFSRFEFDPKTLKTAKQRVAAATAAAFEFEAKAQEEAERSLSGASKPFREVADEYIASTKAKLEPSALLRGNYDFDKNKANTSRNKIGYLKKMVDVAPWFAEKSISEITKEDCEKVIEAVKENGCVRSEYAVILPEYAAMKSTSYGRNQQIPDSRAGHCAFASEYGCAARRAGRADMERLQFQRLHRSRQQEPFGFQRLWVSAHNHQGKQ